VAALPSVTRDSDVLREGAVRGGSK
jgi:hypothetical protein